MSGNPFSDHAFSKMNLILLEKTDTEIITKEVVESSGMAYADRFRVMARWDILSPDERSNRVVLRQSYAVEWLDKPWGLWQIIDPLAHEQMEEDSDQLPEWYERSRVNYLEGLDSGLFEVPKELPFWESP